MQALPLGALLQLGAAWTTNDASQALLPTWALLVALLEAYYLARWLVRQPAIRGWIILWGGIGALATLLLAWYLRLYSANGPLWQGAWISALFHDFQSVNARVEASIGVGILLALLWWRGLRLGRDKIEAEPVARSFKVGFAALVAAALLIGTVRPTVQGGLVEQLGLTLPLFLFVGLVSLSLARLAEIRRGRRQGASQADPTRSWLISMLALSGALVIVLLGIEQAFSYRALLGVVSALRPAWDGISAVLGWIAVGVGYILFWLLNPFVSAIKAAFDKIAPANQPSGQPPQPKPPQLPKGSASLPVEWLVIGRWVLIGIGIIILLIIFIRIFRGIAARRSEEAGDEEREDLGAAGILGAQLRALLASLTSRFQRQRPSEEDLDSVSQHSVRALYRRVLGQASAQGLGRRATETPQEFAQRLGPGLARLPEPSSLDASGTPLEGAAAEAPGVSDPDLEALTKAYEQARYGNAEPSAAQVSALTSDVDRLLQRLAQSQTRLG